MRRALVQFLNTDTDLAAAISGRIYSDIAPENATYPFVVIQRISREDFYNVSSGHDDVCAEQWQVDSYSDTLSESEDVAELIRLHLDVYSGNMGTGAQLVVVRSVRQAGIFDDSELETDDSQRRIYRRSATFEIIHETPQPDNP